MTGAVAQTTNPDGTVNCGKRAGYTIEVGATPSCGLGRRSLKKVRSYLKTASIRDGDRLVVNLRARHRKRYRLRCSVSAGQA